MTETPSGAPEGSSKGTLLDVITRTTHSLSAADKETKRLRDKRKTLMLEAREAGASYSEIAQAAQVTKAYVHQQVMAQIPGKEKKDG